jgi:hypothetical protein
MRGINSKDGKMGVNLSHAKMLEREMKMIIIKLVIIWAYLLTKLNVEPLKL